MPDLGVNIDHVATIRQARRTDEPDPAWAAMEAQLGGATCVTFHLREDRRHIIDRDVPLLKEVVSVKLNMEMSIAPEIVDIAVQNRPGQCTLVPEKREEVTTESGLDVVRLSARVGVAVDNLRGAGILCSAYIEPVKDQILRAAELGFEAVELWTGGYANSKSLSEAKARLTELRRAVEIGRDCGVEVHAGHGLTYRNVGPVAAIPGFSEFNIGHSIIARAVFTGLRQAVREMVDLLKFHGPRGEHGRSRL
jgi:pyridoxine 5-phosphate synthase